VGGSWNPDGVIVFADNTRGLISSAGGVASPPTTIDPSVEWASSPLGTAPLIVHRWFCADVDCILLLYRIALVSRAFPRPVAQLKELKEHYWPEDAAWNSAGASWCGSRFACCRAAWLPQPALPVIATYA
jgi:hypothetical protein